MTLITLLSTPPAALDLADVEAYLTEARTALPDAVDIPLVLGDSVAPHVVRLVFEDDPTYPYYRLPDITSVNGVPLRVLTVDPLGLAVHPVNESPSHQQAAKEVQHATLEAWRQTPLVGIRQAQRHHFAVGEVHRNLSELRTVDLRVIPEGPFLHRIRIGLLHLAASAPHLTADQAQAAETLAADWAGTPVELLDAVNAATTTAVAP